MIDLIFLEDDPILGEEIADFLSEIGYNVTLVTSLAAFNQHFQPSVHKIAVIDVGLPDGSGLSLIEQLRRMGDRIGVVVFSARSTTHDKINGLSIGADHYLGKGCDLMELAATLKALARRLQLPEQSPWRLELGPRRLHTPNAHELALSQQDLVVLKCLMETPGANISRKQIIEALGYDYLTYDQRRLDTQMRRLRRKVTDSSGLQLPVNTLRNSGYCFYDPAVTEA